MINKKEVYHYSLFTVLLLLDLYIKENSSSDKDQRAILRLFGAELIVGHVKNPGISFGYLKDIFPSQSMAYAHIMLSLGLVALLRSLVGNKCYIWEAMLLAGAFGNAHDRIRLGYIVDPLAISYGNQILWWNFADLYINVAIIFFVMIILSGQRLSQPLINEQNKNSQVDSK